MPRKLSKIDLEAYQRLKILDHMSSVYYKGKAYTKADLLKIKQLIESQGE